MTDALTKLIAENKWRPIAEAPRDRRKIMAGRGSKLMVVYWNGGWDDGDYNSGIKADYFTHFRPLPDDRLARVTEVLLEKLKELSLIGAKEVGNGQYLITNKYALAAQAAIEQATAIAEDADESKIRSDQSNCETI